MEEKPIDISLKYKLVLIGDEGVGKTSLMDQCVRDTFSEKYWPSIGVDFICKTVNFNNKNIRTQIWDTVFLLINFPIILWISY